MVQHGILGEDGWIKVYNADSDSLIQTFTSSNWNKYTASNPYYYEDEVKHIRIETSSTNALNYLYVYNIKELDDNYITENFTIEEFENLSHIYSYLSGKMISSSNDGTYYYESDVSNRALYDAPTSIANITIKENTISTHTTAENEKITIQTETTGYNEQKWKDGSFLVELPEEILLAEINEVTTDNENVTVSAYDLYEENNKYYIKILTENNEEETYSIVVDCNITPDPRITQTVGIIKLYAVNELSYDYYYSSADIYDVDGDSNLTELVNYREISLTLNPGSNLTTTQIGSNYGIENGITIAPRVAKTDKNQRTAEISITATNNYAYNIQDIKIVGVVPFEGNDFVLSGKDLGSTFTTYMSEGGIKILTSVIKEYTTVYYSTQENPTNDLDDSLNGWNLAENITDWNSIKTYMIVIDNEYVLATNETLEFEYEISIPEGIDYNEVTYSEHAVYFALETEEGLYYTNTGSSKLGFMIAKQYDLKIVKYQEDTDKTLQGVTFTLTEDGADSSTIKATNEKGLIEISGLYAERGYTLKEQKTSDDYVLNEEKIKFYTYTEINEDGSESLYLVHVNEDGSYSNLTDKYENFVKTAQVNAPDSETEKDYNIYLELENEVKAKLAISKTDVNGQVLKNVKFKLTGEGKEGVILATDVNGFVSVSGIYLGQEYTLEEIKATGYYVPQSAIKFTIKNNSGQFELEYTDNGSTTKKEITTEDEIPTINLLLQNEKIPTYGLQITKYAKNENNKTLAGAQYKIYGEGIKDSGKTYTSDENGIITIDGLYEYVSGKYITGEYTISEIYAPDGYTVNTTELKFKAYREDGTLKIEILEGETVIRGTIDETTEESSTDLEITDSSSSYPVIKIGVEDSQIFTLFKYRKNGITQEKIPIAGTKFAIMDLNSNYVTGSDGKIVGELLEINNTTYYAVTTDENGLISANLLPGLYKAVEIYADDKYVFDENEDNRTYYFGVGTSRAESWDWVNGINGDGWNSINSVEIMNNEGILAAGSFSEYSLDLVTDAKDGIDLNDDEIIDKVSNGNDDGIIIAYDSFGEYDWSKTIGGTDEDVLNKIIQTSDGGYAAVGYVSSSTIKLEGEEITDISKSNYEDSLANKDAILLKLDSNGNYEWSVRLGGTLDDEIKSIQETSEGNFIIVGSFYSGTFNFYETDSYKIKDSFETRGGRDGFIASYSENGKYQWSQSVGGTTDIEVVDVTEYNSGLAVGVYSDTSGNIFTTTEATSKTYTGYASVLGYGLDGTYKWYKSLGRKVTSLDTAVDGSIIAGVNTSSKQYDAQIYKITVNGTTATSTLMYNLSGTYDEYVADVKATSDGGFLLGGWYYSTAGIDVDGDGSTTGKYDLPEILGDYTSDGYVIKLNSSGQVEYASRFYGDGYDGVTSVTETKNGNYISGGYFNSSILYATNYQKEIEEDEEETEEISLLTRIRNTDGFVVSEGATGASVAEQQNIEVENQVKTFDITTEVKADDGTSSDGGTITGDITVDYGEDSTIDIVITPDSGYVIKSIKINDVEYTTFTVNIDGTVTIPAFTNVMEDISVVVEFSSVDDVSNLEVNYYLWTKEEGLTTTKVAESEYYTGEVGEIYTALPKTDIDYELITIAEYLGDETASTEEYIPDNYTGTYEEGVSIIVNYYYKEKTYNITVHHYLDGTNEAVPLKGSTIGEKVEDEILEGYAKGEEYETSQASENLIDYTIYELVEIPENSKGIIKENTEVIYYYKIKTTDLRITKVAEEDHSITISSTEFKLYQSTSSDSNDNLIDTKNVDATWKLVDTYTSSSTGVVKLQGLPITSEYRLVETKASEGRMLPDGQWKIEIIYGEYDESDSSIIEVDGTKLRITAIGNPPALTISEEGKLLLPNKEYFDFPTSGNIGTAKFYQVGMVIIFSGLVLLVMRKGIILKGKKNKRHKRKH